MPEVTSRLRSLVDHPLWVYQFSSHCARTANIKLHVKIEPNCASCGCCILEYKFHLKGFMRLKSEGQDLSSYAIHSVLGTCYGAGFLLLYQTITTTEAASAPAPMPNAMADPNKDLLDHLNWAKRLARSASATLTSADLPSPSDAYPRS